MAKVSGIRYLNTIRSLNYLNVHYCLLSYSSCIDIVWKNHKWSFYKTFKNSNETSKLVPNYKIKPNNSIQELKTTNMGFFQDTVVNKYLKTNDSNTINQAYIRYKEHFHNLRIQENIRNSKEEQYQGEFLIDLFVKVLGYTKNPTDNFNLTTEYKNVKDSKKADGAILINGVVKAVIELKGTNTTDLGKIEEQAFGYKNNQPECIYVITSNFEKLRLYIDNAIEHVEFNLFTLNFKDFELLYLCLAYQNLEKNIPKKIKEESLSEEDVITKKLYKDYSIFKSELFHNIVSLNPAIDSIDLFQKTQKLIDRFLFLFFAEDRSLLPPNSVRLILSDWRDLQDRDEDIGLYDRFKKYFEYLNTGYKGKRYEVFAYNGGLFKLDNILDVLKIDDELLYKHTLKLSEYNFNSEVDVNILGHIFENSLNELDELKAQSEGEAIDRKKTRRKKDGVFYTPKYITKYIVDNTVGKLCIEKKLEIDLKDEDYIYDKKRPKKTTLASIDKLNQYKAWLLQLTICDPACGSGAFLNQALDFLIKEHKYLDELQAKLLGEALVFSDIEKSILENNLYGVDINEESVEIAKLSLWLRTAQPNRKLNDLNNNIKCGNSLIDDPDVAGDKAFNWQSEFPDVFSKGGFDVVIGNPPYVKIQNLKHNEIDWYKKNKIVAFKRIDISIMFFELSFHLLKEKGVLTFITSNQFTVAEYGRNARKFILENYRINKILDYGDLPIFENALTYVSIFTLSKNIKHDFIYHKVKTIEEAKNGKFDNYITVSIDKLNDDNWILGSEIKINILNKLNKNKKLQEIGKCNYGIVSGNDTIYILKNEDIIYNKIEKDCLIPLLRAENCQRYTYVNSDLKILYPYELIRNETELMSIEKIEKLYPNTYNYLIKNKSILEQRKDSRTTFENTSNWYSLTRFGQLESFNQIKIVFPGEQKKPKFCIDKKKSGFSGARVFSITLHSPEINMKYVLGILNSKVIEFYIKNNFALKQGGYYSMSSSLVDKFPIPIQNEQNELISKVDNLLNKNSLIDETIFKYLSSIQRKFNIETFTNKLQNWHMNSYADFIKELSKLKIKLTLSEEAEWEEYFNAERKKALDILAEIESTDKEIDQMVYKLYELTEEEIRIVESSN